MYGSDRHVMTSTGLGINTASPGIFALNVSGDTLLSTSFNVCGLIIMFHLASSLNVSGLTILSNNTTIISSLHVSGFTTLSNNTTFLSSLNVSGKTILGSNIYNYNDSVVELQKKLTIRKNVLDMNGTLIGDIVAAKAGEGNDSSYIS
jgi:hypothetical protein